MMSPLRLSAPPRSPPCASPWKRWEPTPSVSFSRASTACSKNARSPRTIAKWRRNWWFGSLRAAFFRLPDHAGETVFHKPKLSQAARPRFFLDIRYPIKALFIRFNKPTGEFGWAAGIRGRGNKSLAPRAAVAGIGLWDARSVCASGEELVMKSHRVQLWIAWILLTFGAAA